MGRDKNSSFMENGHVPSDPMIVGNRKSAMMRMVNSCLWVSERSKEGYGYCCILFIPCSVSAVAILFINSLFHLSDFYPPHYKYQ